MHPAIPDRGWVSDGAREFEATSSGQLHAADPNEVGEVITWLCPPTARMVTGNLIRMR